MDMLSKGWDSYDAHKKEVEESYNGAIRDFFIKSGTSHTIRFLTKDPVTYYRHTIKYGDKFKSFYCTGNKSCPLCKRGEKKIFVGAFLIYERQFSDNDREYRSAVKIYVAGSRVLDTLRDLPENIEIADITQSDIKVSRTGQGKTTSYQFFPKAGKLSKEDMTIIKEQTENADNFDDFLLKVLKDQIEKQSATTILDEFAEEDTGPDAEDSDVPF